MNCAECETELRQFYVKEPWYEGRTKDKYHYYGSWCKGCGKMYTSWKGFPEP